MTYFCSSCKAPYPETGLPALCPECNGVFTAALPPYQDKASLNLPGIWKYRESFGLQTSAPTVHLGEGNTPLIRVPDSGKEVFAKLEGLNPTGSFKDRNSAVMTSLLLSRVVQEAVEDSSGNAGASFAAYAAYAGIKARIYVPASASGPKLTQMEVSNADVRKINGPRSAASESVLRAIETESLPYASHNYLPHCLAAYATIAYEIVQQLGKTPGSLIAPVGHGNLYLGLHHGFKALVEGGVIDKLPVLMGVQASNCAPLKKITINSDINITEGETLAEGIRIVNPLRWNEITDTIRQNEYPIHYVDEEEIAIGYEELGKLGIFAELTSSVVWDALEKNRQNLPEPIVLLISGHGLKSV